jgi:hypothetical protein
MRRLGVELAMVFGGGDELLVETDDGQKLRWPRLNTYHVVRGTHDGLTPTTFIEPQRRLARIV